MAIKSSDITNYMHDWFIVEEQESGKTEKSDSIIYTKPKVLDDVIPNEKSEGNGTVRMERTIGLMGGIALILGTMIVKFFKIICETC